MSNYSYVMMCEWCMKLGPTMAVCTDVLDDNDSPLVMLLCSRCREEIGSNE